MKGFNIFKARKEEVALDYVTLGICLFITIIDTLIIINTKLDSIKGLFTIIMLIAVVNGLKAVVDIVKYYKKTDELSYYI